MQYIDLEQYAFHYQARLAQELDHDRQVELARRAQRDARDRAAVHAARTGSTAPAWYQRLLGAVLNPTAAASRAAHLARNAVFSH